MIYVCVPVHNEAKTAGLVLWKVRQVFTAFQREYQLLVCDDASTDEITTELDALLDQVKADAEARQRYVDLLEVLGTDDPRTADYRKRLTARLY